MYQAFTKGQCLFLSSLQVLWNIYGAISHNHTMNITNYQLSYFHLKHWHLNLISNCSNCYSQSKCTKVLHWTSTYDVRNCSDASVSLRTCFESQNFSEILQKSFENSKKKIPFLNEIQKLHEKTIMFWLLRWQWFYLKILVKLDRFWNLYYRVFFQVEYYFLWNSINNLNITFSNSLCPPFFFFFQK